ncbi:hypothetical protein BE221DRAFT_206909 [Ostreococcus tauri]|uniref:START domain-containing protein n=1 Tax=Ostreococcus tauri TaxID=70448 RepID=A0A1Y5IAR0_OSTTA|nr:hypothetical protein BE221DRAFT_206909 [Ostreococcus tauri]
MAHARDDDAADALDALADAARTIARDVKSADALVAYGDAHGSALTTSDGNLLGKLFDAFAASDGDGWRETRGRGGRGADASTSRAHQVLGTCETRATADEVFAFFSDASAFDARFRALDEMFKGGDVLSYRLYDDMLRKGMEGRARATRARRFPGFGRGDGPPKFGELFDRLERSGRGGRESADGGNRTVRMSSRKPAMETLETVPRTRAEAPDANNPLGCRPGHAILRGAFRLPSIIRDRDFVWEQLTMKLPNGAVVVAAQSVENGVINAVAPPLEGHVRGKIIVSGYYAAPNPATGGSTLYYVVQADPKGHLPMWVVNAVAPNQAENVARLRNVLDAPKK